MFDFEEVRIPASEPVETLCWEGDTLVDWAAGNIRYFLDGTEARPSILRPFPFTRCVTSPSGEYAALYCPLRTKGIILRNGELIREINRSYYCSDVHEFPVILFQMKNGREVIAHCPEKYNRLEIDDLETGNRLTSLQAREPRDYFFSRLTVDPKGEYLMSAGWWWHPIDVVRLFHIETGLRDPAYFDGYYQNIDADAEDTNAAFTEQGNVLAILRVPFDCSGEEIPDPHQNEPQPFGCSMSTLWKFSTPFFRKPRSEPSCQSAAIMSSASTDHLDCLIYGLGKSFTNGRNCILAGNSAAPRRVPVPFLRWPWI